MEKIRKVLKRNNRQFQSQREESEKYNNFMKEIHATMTEINPQIANIIIGNATSLNILNTSLI